MVDGVFGSTAMELMVDDVMPVDLRPGAAAADQLVHSTASSI
jgi:hypothetical protein